MTRKAQAALEFLSTYGFAFLIILVMVGALVYFGVLNPQRFLPERCILGSEFECRDFQLDATGSAGAIDVNLVIINNVGDTIATLANPVVTITETGDTASGAACSFTVATGLAPGAPTTLSCTVPAGNTYPDGDKLKVQVDFDYTKQGGTFPHEVGGEILATVQ